MALSSVGPIYPTGPDVATSELWTTGSILYVDSVNGSNSNGGTTPAAPMQTLAAAISAANASTGDIIALMPGFSASYASTQTLKAGLRVVGLGTGGQKARLTLNFAGALITASGLGCAIENCVFPVATTASATFKVTCTAQGVVIRDCDFYCGANDSTYMVNVAASSASVIGCTFTSSARAGGGIHVTTNGQYFRMQDTSFDGGSAGWGTLAFNMDTGGTGLYDIGPGIVLSNSTQFNMSNTAEKGRLYGVTLGTGCGIAAL